MINYVCTLFKSLLLLARADKMPERLKIPVVYIKLPFGKCIGHLIVVHGTNATRTPDGYASLCSYFGIKRKAAKDNNYY
jgi:hypothetical protein